MYSDDEDLMKAPHQPLPMKAVFVGTISTQLWCLMFPARKSVPKVLRLWQCSHSQYKDMDSAKMRLWAELKADDGQDSCPISGFTNAYPVKVIRKTDKKLNILLKSVEKLST